VGSDATVEEPIEATETNGVWGPATEIPVSGGYGEFMGVSCSGVTDCTAVGSYGDVSGLVYATETNGVWGPATEIPVSGGSGTLPGVSCSDAADCTAVGANGNELIYVTSS
jgi:hypothetical protein